MWAFVLLLEIWSINYLHECPIGRLEATKISFFINLFMFMCVIFFLCICSFPFWRKITFCDWDIQISPNHIQSSRYITMEHSHNFRIWDLDQSMLTLDHDIWTEMIILHANYNCRFLHALSVVFRESWADLLQTNFDSLDKIEISLPIIYWTSSKWIGTLRTYSYKNESCLNHNDFKSTYNNIHGKKKNYERIEEFWRSMF